MDTNKHDIIVTEAFCAALFRVRSQQVKEEVKVCALYASLYKVDTDWFNRNVTVNPNAHWLAHHLHLELPLAGAEFVDDCRLQPHPGERGDGFPRRSIHHLLTDFP